MRRILGTLILLAAVLCAVTAAPATAAPSKHYLSGKFTNKSVDRFTRDLAKVGIGVYRPGASRPVRKVSGRKSPLRLSTDQALTAALGARSGVGTSAGMLDALSGPARVTAKVSLPVGAVVAGWARKVHSPSARLARRILGKQDWSNYRAVVLPNVVTLLFASDAALHLTPAGRVRGKAAVMSAAATEGPCTGALHFIDNTINQFFDSLGRLSADRATIEKILGKNAASATVTWIGNALSFVVNKTVDGGRAVVLAGRRVPIKMVINAISGVAGTVSVIGTVANALNRWSGTITSKPTLINRAVGVGVPGAFMLKVTAPGSNLQWAPWLVDCASPEVFDFPLPTLTPKAAQVKWDISEQDPAGLIVRTGDTGPLDDRGTAQMTFETTPETPEQAAGESDLGVVNAKATVHRADLDNLRDEVTNRIFRMLPGIIRDTAGAKLRSILEPMIKKITRKVTEIQDVEVPGLLVVRYHKSKDKPGSGKRLRLPDPCKLVTQQEASIAAGTATTSGIYGSGVDFLGLGSSSACIFQDPGYPRAFVRVDVLDVAGDAPARFAAIEAQAISNGLKTGEVAGLGDDNFYWVGPQGQALLFARKANIVFELAVLLPGTGGNAIPLAKKVVGRI